MDNNRHSIIRDIATSQSKLIQLLLVGISLAFGVNLIASSFVASSILGSLWIVLIGVFICFVSTFFLTILLFKLVERRSYQAFFVYDQEQKEMVSVPRYRFSEKVCNYVSKAFTENAALKALWTKEPLQELYSLDLDRGVSIRKPMTSAQLVSEVVEYFALNHLSTHLTDYFNDEKFNEENLRTFNRSDIPEILLTNRFFELFSKPMEERPAFLNDKFSPPTKARACAAYTGGAIYERFALVLPKESIVRRTDTNTIEIETKKFRMSIEVDFDGVLATTPDGFEQYYLGFSKEDSFERFTIYRVNINIQVSMKWGALFTWLGREYYRWVDSLMYSMEQDVSQDAFFKRIDWESAFTVLMCLERTERKDTQNRQK